MMKDETPEQQLARLVRFALKNFPEESWDEPEVDVILRILGRCVQDRLG